MEFSRDDARITHTYEFITAVAYLRDQYPQHKADKIADLLNIEYYADKRGKTKITNIDVHLAFCIIDQTPPSWLEGKLFYSAVYGIDYQREEYAELTKPNWRLLQHLAKQLRIEIDRKTNVLNQIRNCLAVVDRQQHFGGNTLGYWKDKLPEVQQNIINATRKVLVDGKRMRRYWSSLFWFEKKDPENYALPLTFKRVAVPGVPNAAKVYIRTRRHQLCLCTRNSYLIVGV